MNEQAFLAARDLARAAAAEAAAAATEAARVAAAEAAEAVKQRESVQAAIAACKKAALLAVFDASTRSVQEPIEASLPTAAACAARTDRDPRRVG